MDDSKPPTEGPSKKGEEEQSGNQAEKESETKLGLNEAWSDSSSEEGGDYDNQPHGTLADQVSTDYPFHDAIENNDSEAFKKLLATRKEKFEKFKEAVLAAQQNAGQVALSDVDDPLSEKDEEGLTPLQLAILERDLEFVKLCLEAGADTSIHCQKSSLIHLVLGVGSIPENKSLAFDILKEVIVKSAPIKQKDDLNRTPLHVSAEYGLTECFTYLLDQGASEIIDEIDLQGRTALHVACQVGCAEIVDLLIARGVGVNVQDNDGYTPLHVAVRSGCNECIISLVVEGKADKTILNNDKLTALDLAKRVEYEDVICLLEQDITDEVKQRVTTLKRTKANNKRTLLLSHKLCSEHHTCPPALLKNRAYSELPNENVNRLTVLLHEKLGVLRSYRINRFLEWKEPNPAEIVDILRVHEYQYVQKLKSFCETLGPTEIGELDGDTTISRMSFEAARIAAGSVCDAIDKVCGEETHRNAFCAVRPPGHHAGPRGVVRSKHDPQGSYGFCLLSNAALGAAYARNIYRHRGVSRVAVIDFDVHHGNGTEACFRNVLPSMKSVELHPIFCDVKLSAPSYKPWLNENDGRDTFFASIHGYGKRIPGFDPDPRKPPHIGNFYPSSGENCGFGNHMRRANGEPHILNVGQNSKRRVEWRQTWRDEVLPALVEFNPDLIIISAGFDAHRRDDINMGYISAVEFDYYWLTRELVKIGNLCCDGKVVSVLEGGYAIHGRVVSPFARSVSEHVAALIETSPYEQYDAELVQAERRLEMEKHVGEDGKVVDLIEKRLAERGEDSNRRSKRQTKQGPDYFALNKEMGPDGDTDSDDDDQGNNSDEKDGSEGDSPVEKRGNAETNEEPTPERQEDEPVQKKARTQEE